MRNSLFSYDGLLLRFCRNHHVYRSKGKADPYPRRKNTNKKANQPTLKGSPLTAFRNTQEDP